MTVTPADALKGALDILHPLATCSPIAMGMLNQETGIQRSRVNRQIKRIEMAIGQMEEEKMKLQDIDSTAPNYRSGISKEML